MFSYHTGNGKTHKKRDQDLSFEYAPTPHWCPKDKFDSTGSKDKPAGRDISQPRPPTRPQSVLWKPEGGAATPYFIIQGNERQ